MVYLLCFNSKLAHAKHYIGYCNEGGLEARIEKHRKGTGAKIMAAVVKSGIEFEVARVWEGADRNFERKLKNQKNAARICPHCKKMFRYYEKMQRLNREINKLPCMDFTLAGTSTQRNPSIIDEYVQFSDTYFLPDET